MCFHHSNYIITLLSKILFLSIIELIWFQTFRWKVFCVWIPIYYGIEMTTGTLLSVEVLASALYEYIYTIVNITLGDNHLPCAQVVWNGITNIWFSYLPFIILDKTFHLRFVILNYLICIVCEFKVIGWTHHDQNIYQYNINLPKIPQTDLLFDFVCLPQCFWIALFGMYQILCLLVWVYVISQNSWRPRFEDWAYGNLCAG